MVLLGKLRVCGLSGQARRLLLLHVFLNAILYSALLPLWEGFDEPFHFGYVQQLANGWGFPDARTARLSREVAESLSIAPASLAVKQNLPDVTTYPEYFSWPSERRRDAARALRSIPPAHRWQSSQFLNYEAMQAPLAQALLAVPERLLWRVPLPLRVLWLRFLAGAAGSMLLLAGASVLCSQLGAPAPYRDIALFCALSSQMIWAAIAHVANDWLAIPLAVWTLVAMVRFAAAPRARHAILAALILSAGLLTKAYFLELAPVMLILAAWRGGLRRAAWPAATLALIAGPWYFRNLSLYGTLTGTQESRAGITFIDALKAAPGMHWPAIAYATLHSALWTANNTFRTFSEGTVNLLLFVCLAALAMWALSRPRGSELLVAAYAGVLLLGLAYIAAVAGIATRGVSSTPGPWLAQVVVTPLLILCALGASRWPRTGLAAAAILPLLFGYMLAATYVVKLIPLYAGYAGKSTPGNIVALYTRHTHELAERLGSVALGPAPVIFGLTAAVVILIVAQLAVLLRQLAGQSESCTSMSRRAGVRAPRPPGGLQPQTQPSGPRYNSRK